MSLSFELADKIFREYGLVQYPIRGGRLIEYAFADRKSHTRKRNVAINVSPLKNGGVGGYLYVGYLKEFKFRKEVTIGYPYIKTLDEYVRINELTETELRNYLSRITSFYS